MKYNGWSNYETWLVFTWLTNVEGSNSYWYTIGRKHSRLYVSEHLEETIEELCPFEVPESGLYHDLWHSALESIDYDELADAFCSEEDE